MCTSLDCGTRICTRNQRHFVEAAEVFLSAQGRRVSGDSVAVASVSTNTTTRAFPDSSIATSLPAFQSTRKSRHSPCRHDLDRARLRRGHPVPKPRYNIRWSHISTIIPIERTFYNQSTRIQDFTNNPPTRNHIPVLYKWKRHIFYRFTRERNFLSALHI